MHSKHKYFLLLLFSLWVETALSVSVTLTPDQSIRLREGSPLRIICTVEGHYTSEVALYRNQEHVGVHSGTNVIYETRHAKLSDAGPYHCYGYSRVRNELDHKMVKVDIERTVFVNPPSEEIERYVGESFVLSCFELLQASDNIQWKKLGGEISSKAEQSNKGQLRISSATILDGGEYACFTELQEKLFKVFITTRGSPSAPTKACEINEATCRNGACVPRNKLCDGHRDCDDGSDETACGAVSWLSNDLEKCDPTERLCGDNTCRQKLWFCDGEYDCADRSDEVNCAAKNPGDVCETWEHLCRSGNQCVNKGFVCDEQYDCLDGSDEIGCDKPRIVRGPPREIEVCEGETVTIDCEAAGFPTPFINWRLNWGHICPEPRCVTSNNNGVGVLTIYNTVPSDSGAYSCEAINNLGRLFAIDAIVRVKSAPCGSCNCHNHSNKCNRDYECVECQHNTYGRNCQYCLPGFTGDATRGTAYDCERVIQLIQCNPEGIIPGTSSRGASCRCKPGYAGVACDRCDVNTFRDSEGRCIECFCNGLQDVSCGPSSLYYNMDRSNFYSTHHGWTVVNRFANYTSQYSRTNTKIGAFEFYGFQYESYENTWFFNAPSNFKGNRLTSYGGNISFVLFYEGEPEDGPMQLELRISGVKIALHYTHHERLYPYEEHHIHVPIFENNFRRHSDGGPVAKDHMLMALSNIDMILITASFVRRQYTASLREFNFDIAKVCNDSSREKPIQAVHVEICRCPVGYNGTSCERCAPGYDKSNREGQYLGLCYPDCKIVCNGHSDDCNEHGTCYNCKHNTTGEHCDVCAPGYDGDATIGQSDDCYPINENQ